MQIFPAILYIYYIYSYRLGEKVTAQSWIFFDKKILILVSSSRIQCFRIRPRLQQSFPCSQQNIKQYHSVWCTAYLDSIFYVSIFIVSGKRKREEKNRETLPSLHYYFLFFQVGCTAMLFHTVFCSARRNWRELYKNLTVLSSLDAYT